MVNRCGYCSTALSRSFCSAAALPGPGGAVRHPQQRTGGGIVQRQRPQLRERGRVIRRCRPSRTRPGSPARPGTRTSVPSSDPVLSGRAPRLITTTRQSRSSCSRPRRPAARRPAVLLPAAPARRVPPVPAPPRRSPHPGPCPRHLARPPASAMSTSRMSASGSGGIGAPCQDCSWRVSPILPPHPACGSHRTGRSMCLGRWISRMARLMAGGRGWGSASRGSGSGLPARSPRR